MNVKARNVARNLKGGSEQNFERGTSHKGSIITFYMERHDVQRNFLTKMHSTLQEMAFPTG